MSGGLDKVYHFVHIGFDPGEHPLFEEGLKEVLEKIAEETKAGVRSALVFVDEPFQKGTKIPANIGRRKRIYDLVKHINNGIPIIDYGMFRGDTCYEYYYSDFCYDDGRNFFLKRKFIESRKKLEKLGLTNETEHFVCGEYLGECVKNYSKMIRILLGYNSSILGETSFGCTLIKNPSLIKPRELIE